MDLRKEKLAVRKGLSREEAALKSNKICKNLLANPWVMDAKVILTYLPYGNEVSLLSLNEYFWQRSVKVLVPVCSKSQDGIMDAVELTREDLTDLEKNKLGVSEPKRGFAVEPSLIDLVLVPGVVFDTKGNRMGHGKGYYDRYLPGLKSDAKTVGIAYEVQLAANLPVNSWDYPLDALCTENQLYIF